MTRKQLGKIKSVRFGLGGYQGACIGIHFDLGGDGWGVTDTKSTWDINCVKYSKDCEWTEEDREKECVEIVKFISNLLNKAKVDSIDKLRGIPIECTFDGQLLKEWRILEEVI